MFFLHFSDTYINIVNYLQRVPLTDAICIKMLEKIIQKYQRWDHNRSTQKKPLEDVGKRILET